MDTRFVPAIRDAMMISDVREIPVWADPKTPGLDWIRRLGSFGLQRQKKDRERQCAHGIHAAAWRGTRRRQAILQY